MTMLTMLTIITLSLLTQPRKEGLAAQESVQHTISFGSLHNDYLSRCKT